MEFAFLLTKEFKKKSKVKLRNKKLEREQFFSEKKISKTYKSIHYVPDSKKIRNVTILNNWNNDIVMLYYLKKISF